MFPQSTLLTSRSFTTAPCWTRSRVHNFMDDSLHDCDIYCALLNEVCGMYPIYGVLWFLLICDIFVDAIWPNCDIFWWYFVAWWWHTWMFFFGQLGRLRTDCWCRAGVVMLFAAYACGNGGNPCKRGVMYVHQCGAYRLLLQSCDGRCASAAPKEVPHATTCNRIPASRVASSDDDNGIPGSYFLTSTHFFPDTNIARGYK